MTLDNALYTAWQPCHKADFPILCHMLQGGSATAAAAHGVGVRPHEGCKADENENHVQGEHSSVRQILSLGRK